MQQLDKVDEIVDNIATGLYVYCPSGVRSRQATAILQHMGYANVRNTGSIAAYHGKLDR